MTGRVVLIAFCLSLTIGNAFCQNSAVDKKVDEAIQDLGASDFKVREEASSTLLLLGLVARPALERATKHDDPEISMRASQILKDFREGKIPSISKEFQEQVKKFKSGNVNVKKSAITALLQSGGEGVELAFMLLDSETDAHILEQMMTSMKTWFIRGVEGELAQGNFDKAESILRQMVKIDGSLSSNLALFLHMTGKAKVDIERCKALYKKDPEIARFLAHLYHAEGMMTEALDAVGYGDIENRPSLKQLYLAELGEWDKLVKLQDSEPEKSFLYSKSDMGKRGCRITFNRLAGNDKATEKEIDKLVEYAQRGDDKRKSDAVEILMLNDAWEEVDLLVEEGDLYKIKASLLYGALRCDELIDLFNKAKEIGYPEILSIQTLAGLIDPAYIDTDKMLQDRVKNAAVSSETRSADIRQADGLAVAEKWEEAAKAYKVALDVNPVSPVLNCMYGLALMKSGHKKEGADYMLRGELLPLNSEKKRAKLAIEFKNRGLLSNYHRQYDLLLKCPIHACYTIAQGYRYSAFVKSAEEGDYEQAVKMLELSRIPYLDKKTYFYRAVSYQARSSMVLAYTILADVKAGNKKDAQKKADLFFQINPDFSYDVCEHLVKMGEKKMAKEIFDRAYDYISLVCEKYEDNPYVHNGLAWLTAISRERLDDGLKLSLRSVELSPDNVAHLDTLAEVYFQLGNTEKAIEVIQKCDALEPENTDTKAYIRRQLKRFKKGDNSTYPEE